MPLSKPQLAALLSSALLGAGCNVILGLGDFQAGTTGSGGSGGGTSSTTGSTTTTTGSTPNLCADGVRDGTESDDDCGGSCDPCVDGKTCNGPTDCVSKVCVGTTCHAPACNDSATNAAETDVDCGGGTCPACADGKSCKKPTDCSSLLCKGGSCQANFVFANGFGDGAVQRGVIVATDGAGSTLVAGTFQGDIDLGGMVLKAIAPGTSIFVAKLDAAGNHVFSRSFGNALDQRVTGLAADADGNVYLSGVLDGTIDFGDGAKMGSQDIVLVKLSPTGATLWSKDVGGVPANLSVNVPIGPRLAVDAGKNVFVFGDFTGTVDFGQGALISNGTSLYLAKLDPAGNTIFAKKYGDSSAFAGAIAPSADGSVLLTGGFYGTLNFGNGPTTNNDINSELHVFVARVGGGGAGVYCAQYGHNGLRSLGLSIAAGPADEAFVSGEFQSSIDIGNDSISGGGGTFLAELVGAAPVWAQGLGGAGDARVAQAGGALYLGGSFAGTLSLGALPSIDAKGSTDVFAARLDLDGTPRWLRAFGDPGPQHTAAVAAAPAGELILTGDFQGAIDFGGGAIQSAGGSIDAFLARLRIP